MTRLFSREQIKKLKELAKFSCKNYRGRSGSCDYYWASYRFQFERMCDNCRAKYTLRRLGIKTLRKIPKWRVNSDIRYGKSIRPFNKEFR